MSGDSGDGEIFISLKSNITLADRKCFGANHGGRFADDDRNRAGPTEFGLLVVAQFWLDAAAGEFQIQVQANVVYQVKIEADWIEWPPRRRIAAYLQGKS